MLKFNLLADEELCSVIDIFISGLLPHDKYSVEYYGSILETLFKYVRLEEFTLEYRIILDVLTDYGRLKSAFDDFKPALTRDILERLLEASIMDTVQRDDIGIKDWLEYDGISSNLAVQAVKEDVCQKLCYRTLDLYDRCFTDEVESACVIGHEPELRAAFIAHVGAQCLNVQADIIRHEVRVGRKRYSGFNDWLTYVTGVSTEIADRLHEADESRTITLDTVDGSYALMKQLSSLLVPIADYGIPEIDAYTPILRHRLVVIVGKENIGKTKFVVDQAVNVILSGHKVVMMCGESHKSAVFGAVMINYVYKKYGISIRAEHLAAPELCPDEVRKVIGMSVDEISSEGLMTLCDAFNYATYYNELCTLYDKLHFDVVIVDHSCALVGSVGNGSVKDKVDRLAEDSRRFKKKYPVCVMVTSHPSVASKESAKKGQTTEDSPTKGSQNLSTEADELFFLRDNETLRKQNLIMLENTKRRDASLIIEPIILRKRFDVSAFIYDETLQGRETAMTVQRDEALRIIEEQCSITDEDDIYCLE